MAMVFDQALIPEEFKIEFFTILPVVSSCKTTEMGYSAIMDRNTETGSVLAWCTCLT